jgi:hypothetical protein
MLGTAALGLVGGGLLCLGALAAAFLPALAPYAWFFGFACAVGVSAAVAWLALLLGARRLPLVGEA